jgi:hypothetical protein
MIPERIGRYEVRRELGRGGMASVYLAHDPSFGRDVAIKVLPSQFLHDPTFRARFEREARTIAALEHPAIVPVYDFGQEGEQPYLVMRAMAGGSLLDRMRSGPLPQAEIESIARRIASALDHAHSQGIIHRDLKPGNILFDQQGNAFLTDFGIAKLAESTATFTGSGIIGTPAYMSPEQIQGDKDLDGRSDIYALGIILFEMLTGQSPYRADTPAKLMMKHVLDPVPHISQVKPDLPPDYDTVLGKALAKDRNQRFSSAGEMANALQLAATGEYTVPAAVQDQTMIERPAAAATVANVGQTIVEHPSRPATGPQAARPATGPQAAPPTAAAYPPTQIDAPPVAAPAAVQEKRRGVPIWAWVVGGLLVLLCLVAGGVGAMYGLGFFDGDEEGTQVAEATVEVATPEGATTSEPATAEPTEAPATDTPAPTAVPLTFAKYQDGSGRISLQFPNQWTNEAGELEVQSSPDMTAWKSSFAGRRQGAATQPGLFVKVVDQQEDEIDDGFIQQVVADFDFPNNCEPAMEEPYDDGRYVGSYNSAVCDGGTYVLLVAYDLGNPTYYIWLEAYTMNDQDEEVLAHTLDTFSIVPPPVVEVPPTDTPEPTATPTSPPQPTSAPAPTSPPAPPPPPPANVRTQLLAQMKATQQDMQNMGGMIDNAVNTGYINCRDVVSTYDRVVNAPSFDVSNADADTRSAHSSYRSSISIFSNGVRDLAENCRSFISGGGGGSIPFSQWGPARQSVNQALDVLNPAIENLE